MSAPVLINLLPAAAPAGHQHFGYATVLVGLPRLQWGTPPKFTSALLQYSLPPAASLDAKVAPGRRSVIE